MTHDSDDVIGARTEIAQLRDENAQLRTMIAIMLRTLEQVEICLQIALDGEKK